MTTGWTDPRVLLATTGRELQYLAKAARLLR
jgi:hypothetical protein